MLIYHKGHTDTIQVYSVTVMTHVKALQAGHSSQGTSEPITPVCCFGGVFFICVYCFKICRKGEMFYKIKHFFLTSYNLKLYGIKLGF